MPDAGGRRLEPLGRPDRDRDGEPAAALVHVDGSSGSPRRGPRSARTPGRSGGSSPCPRTARSRRTGGGTCAGSARRSPRRSWTRRQATGTPAAAQSLSPSLAQHAPRRRPRPADRPGCTCRCDRGGRGRCRSRRACAGAAEAPGDLARDAELLVLLLADQAGAVVHGDADAPLARCGWRRRRARGCR